MLLASNPNSLANCLKCSSVKVVAVSEFVVSSELFSPLISVLLSSPSAVLLSAPLVSSLSVGRSGHAKSSSPSLVSLLSLLTLLSFVSFVDSLSLEEFVLVSKNA